MQAYQRIFGTTNTHWALLVWLCLFTWGCQRTETTATSIDAPAQPTRIVSLAPNVTEILFALGKGPAVVGVTKFCDYPPEVEKLPRVGGLIDPNVEAILALKPDLVIGVTSSGDPSIARALENAKIPFSFQKMESLEETFAGINAIGRLVGATPQANELVADMRGALSAFEGVPMEGRPKVLMVFGHNPIVAAGPNTFADELIVRAGGQNALAGSQAQWPTLDPEKVLELDPDRILDLSMTAEHDDTFWEKFPSLSAAQTHNIYQFTDASMMRPGPRLIDAYRRLAMAIRGKHHVH
ncbi:MAG: ABC transporter substrate-binding protein [bacterium]